MCDRTTQATHPEMTDPKAAAVVPRAEWGHNVRLWRNRGLVLLAAAAIWLGAGLTGFVCVGAAHRLIRRSELPVEAVRTYRVRDVRVLLADSANSMLIRSVGSPVVQDRQGRRLISFEADRSIRVEPGSSGRLIVDGAEVDAAEVDISAQESGIRLLIDPVTESEQAFAHYPGMIRVERNSESPGLRVCNLVDVETYVAGVVAGEVWPTFHVEAFRAQAVAARTYVLYEMSRRSSAAYDVTATQASQVYRGLRNDDVGAKAEAATRHTRGVVCCHAEGGRNRLFCAYYSAACGGVSQPASVFGPEGNIRPLSGGVRCDDCRMAPKDTYRWGPVRLPLEEVQAGLFDRFPDLRELGRIRSISIVERTYGGRAVWLQIAGDHQATRRVLAERFRHAIGPSLMRSTHCEMAVDGISLELLDGRGFGHGLGLCQWGSQGLALKGRSAAWILRFYYPGSKLARAYR